LSLIEVFKHYNSQIRQKYARRTAAADHNVDDDDDHDPDDGDYDTTGQKFII